MSGYYTDTVDLRENRLRVQIAAPSLLYHRWQNTSGSCHLIAEWG